MAKRKGDSDDDSPHKRRRNITDNVEAKQEPQLINTFEDLRVLLAFEQDASPSTGQKIKSFKQFLDSIAYGKESNEKSTRRKLLLDYLRSQVPAQNDEDSSTPPDLIKTWHFAAQSNVESLFSSVAAVLALLLRTISSLIEFRTWGNHLCRSLLQDEQIKLFDIGLSANKAKKYLISSCLRLLTEVVSFDGGHAARSLFRRRQVTLKNLETYLTMRKDARDGEPQLRRKPSIRDNALQYLYANLRLQNSTARLDILSQKRVIRAWFDDISEDSAHIVFEMLEALKNDIALDPLMSHSTKSHFFSEWVLGRLATLYSYKEPGDIPEGQRSVQKATHELLLFLCLSPGLGVLNARNEGHRGIQSSDADGNAWRSQYTSMFSKSSREDRYAPKNIKLANFLQTLRPYASLPQCSLIISVFRNTPEMISEYFLRRKSFSFDPKATATWVGYASFILATVQLPLPEILAPKSMKDPVLSSYATLIESVIPSALTQKALTRCLNQGADLVKFLALRILVAAFQKLARVLQNCKDVQKFTDEDSCVIAWTQTASNITAEFCKRVPDMETVIAQFRCCPQENVLLRESITRLLALYYEIVPQVALEQIFDISVALSSAFENKSVQPEGLEDGLRLLDLEHLLAIAERSPHMQWFHKPDAMWLSPFTTLLKMHCDRKRNGPLSRAYRDILEPVALEHQILLSYGSLDRLSLSLQESPCWRPSNHVFEFLDNCILRLARKAVHYYDVLNNLVVNMESEISAGDVKIDLLLVAVMEQWPFLAKRVDPVSLANVSLWLVRYLDTMRLSSGHDISPNPDSWILQVISNVRDEIRANTEDKVCRKILRQGCKSSAQLEISDQTTILVSPSRERKAKELDLSPKQEVSRQFMDLVPPGPPREDETHIGLNKWSREDIQDAISDGAVEELFLCLSSEHVEIRKQALNNISALMEKLEASGYSEWQQIFVLTGELFETTKEIISATRVPYFTGVLAAHLLQVLTDPLHFMYAKVNKFLNKGPQWKVGKLPSYWVDKLLLNPPSEDEAHYQEVEWLLDILIDGLRTRADMEIYSRCNILERLLSLSTSPILPGSCSQKIVDLLFRCTYAEGSSTLITRCGVISWIAACHASKSTSDDMKPKLKALASRLFETSNKDHVIGWSNGTLASTLDRLRLS